MPLNYRMPVYKILFFSVCFFLCACGSKTPPGIIEKKQMVDVLTDVHIVDANLNNISQHNDSLYKYGMGQYLQVFKAHHTDSAQFKKSFAYYSRYPDQLNDMYDEVLSRLKFRVDSVNKVIQEKARLKQKADSVNAVKQKAKLKADSVNEANKKKAKLKLKADSLNKIIQKKANGVSRK